MRRAPSLRLCDGGARKKSLTSVSETGRSAVLAETTAPAHETPTAHGLRAGTMSLPRIPTPSIVKAAPPPSGTTQESR